MRIQSFGVFVAKKLLSFAKRKEMNIQLTTTVKGNYKTIMARFDRQLFEALAPPFPPMEVVEFTGSREGDRVHIRFLDRVNWISLITIHDLQIVGGTTQAPEAFEEALLLITTGSTVWLIATEGLTQSEGDLSNVRFGMRPLEMVTALDVVSEFIEPAAYQFTVYCDPLLRTLFVYGEVTFIPAPATWKRSESSMKIPSFVFTLTK